MDIFFKSTKEDKYTLCSVKGEIDLYNAKALKDKVSESLEEAGDAPKLVLDMQNVKYIDSTGLGIIIGIKRRITESGGALALVISEDRIFQLFTITGLSKIFTITRNIEEAVSKVQ